MTFRFGAVDVPVIVDHGGELDADSYGEFVIGTEGPYILLSPDMEDGDWRDLVVLHEWAHAFWDVSGINNIFETNHAGKELFCDLLAHAILQLMKEDHAHTT